MAYSQYVINSTTMTSLANAVRSLWSVSSTTKYTPSQMISKINEYVDDPPIIIAAQYIMDSTIQTISNSKVIYIAEAAFYDCTNLTTTIFSNCEHVGTDAFHSCAKLVTIDFPKCTLIDNGGFYRCSKITTASFPKCTSIGSAVFSGCLSLNNISFPVCTYIAQYAFNNCSKLSTVSFPKCSYIGNSAFYNCKSLSSLYLNQVTSVTTLAGSAFAGTPLSAGGTGKIYVPSSLLASFKTARYWSTLSARLVGV